MTVMFRGKIKKVDLGDKTKEDFAKAKLLELKGNNFQLKKRWKSHLDFLLEEHYDDFMVNPRDDTDENIYEMIEKEEIEINTHLEKTKNDDGSVSFIIGYDDRGFGISEAIPEFFE